MSDKSMFPDNKYSIILADPPWKYYGSTTKWGAAAKFYECMSVEELSNLPVRDLSDKSTALFLWATCPRLPDALAVMHNWGFNYRGMAFVWVKTTKNGDPIGAQGVPPTFVKPVIELLLVGTVVAKGRPFKINNLKQRQLVFAPKEEHSKKPDIFRDLIVGLCGDLPRIELFARQKVDGWDGWGNEY